MQKTISIIRVSLFLSIIFVLFSISCSSGKENKINRHQDNVNKIAEVEFDTTYHDFGTLVQGEKASFTFYFMNTGNADLIVKDAFSMCGCTVPSFSKEPISPGNKGKIEVVFNSEGKHGLQYKTVSLRLNTKIEEKSLVIKANVIEKLI